MPSSRVRPLAVTGTKRASCTARCSDVCRSRVPMPEMNAGVWWGLLGPAGLPRNIVVKLNETIAQALAAPDVLARLSALNLDPMIMTRSVCRFHQCGNRDLGPGREAREYYRGVRPVVRVAGPRAIAASSRGASRIISPTQEVARCHNALQFAVFPSVLQALFEAWPLPLLGAGVETDTKRSMK